MVNTQDTKKHSKYSCSSIFRWKNCPGSIKLSESAPPQIESPYAREGTEAHSLLEKILKNYLNGKGAVVDLKTHTDKEMIKHALAVAEEIVKLADGDPLVCEQKVSLEFIHPEMFGTLDAAIISEFGRLTVIDLKYGQGISVEPEENDQLLGYALAVAHQYDYNFSEVALRIIQPRAYHPISTSREWVTDIARLKKFSWELARALGETKRTDPPLKSGDWCRWCPSATICPELSSKAMKQAGLDFALEVVPDSIPMPSLQDLGKTLSAISKLETWIDAVKTFALQEAERGIRVDGWKLVNKRSTRRWIDEQSTVEKAWPKYGDKIYSKPELLSPAQFEKATKDKEFVHDHTIDVSSGVTLVEEKDRRQEVNQLELDFGSDTLEKPKQLTKGKQNE